MKKNILILFNCHGNNYSKYLKQNKLFCKYYKLRETDVEVISIVDYVDKESILYNNTELQKNHVKKIKNADVLILQYIEKDRGFLNNNNIIKMCKKDCIIIKIPHYRNSIYEHKLLEGFTHQNKMTKEWTLPQKINNINDAEQNIEIIKNEINIMNNYNYDKKKLLNSFKYKYEEFKKIDNLSDIKMLDYYQNNYKKYRLFSGRGYPSSRFFYELTNRILIKLGFKPNTKFIDLYFAEHTTVPIPDYWYKFCNFTFDNKCYAKGHIEITEYEWYYILLLSNKRIIKKKKDCIKYLSIIRQTRKKNLLVIFNCHRINIRKYLKQNKNMVEKYHINSLSIENYVVKDYKFYNNTELDDIHKKKIKNADVLILQYIEKDRGFLNNNNIIKMCKKDCIIIKIPHYRNSIYQHKLLEGFNTKEELLCNWTLPQKINNINDAEQNIEIIKNEINIMNNYNYDKKKLLNEFKNKYEEFKKIDNLSDIKMLDYYQNNYNKYRLFQERGYPSSRFFYELTNRILIKLGFKPNTKFIDLYFAENSSTPIPDYWYKFCNFTFDNKCYHTDGHRLGHIEITEYEWYYILLLSKKYWELKKWPLILLSVKECIKYLSIIRQTS